MIHFVLRKLTFCSLLYLLPSSPNLTQFHQISSSFNQNQLNEFIIIHFSQPLTKYPNLPHSFLSSPNFTKPHPALPCHTQPYPASPSLTKSHQTLIATQNISQPHLTSPNFTQFNPTSPNLTPDTTAYNPLEHLASMLYDQQTYTVID